MRVLLCEGRGSECTCCGSDYDFLFRWIVLCLYLSRWTRRTRVMRGRVCLRATPSPSTSMTRRRAGPLHRTYRGRRRAHGKGGGHKRHRGQRAHIQRAHAQRERKAYTSNRGEGVYSIASCWGVVECMSSRYWRADVSLFLYCLCLCVCQWVVCAWLVPRVRLCGEWGASAQQ